MSRNESQTQSFRKKGWYLIFTPNIYFSEITAAAGVGQLLLPVWLLASSLSPSMSSVVQKDTELRRAPKQRHYPGDFGALSIKDA